LRSTDVQIPLDFFTGWMRHTTTQEKRLVGQSTLGSAIVTSEEAAEKAWDFALRFMHSGHGRGFCGAQATKNARYPKGFRASLLILVILLGGH
jgi:hypothetical protein